MTLIAHKPEMRSLARSLAERVGIMNHHKTVSVNSLSSFGREPWSLSAKEQFRGSIEPQTRGLGVVASCSYVRR